MAGVGAQLAKRIGIFIVVNIVGCVCMKIIDNKLDGKTWNGKEKINEQSGTYVDWRGNVILGEQDGWVV